MLGTRTQAMNLMVDVSEYELVIDARSPREFAEDHIPGAVNLPVVDNDEYAEVGTLHRTDKHRAYRIGVARSLRNIARHIDEVIAPLPERARILVYCFRGGKRSRLWFDALDTIGFRVERLEGGWKAYRRWVNGMLAEVPRRYRYRVLCGPTGCGKTRLLAALRETGAQVLDLEALANHRGSLIGAIPGEPQPSQKYFDSLLLRELLRFDPERPVWVEAESKRIGLVQLPDALFDAMHAGTCYAVEAHMAERVALWREDYGHFEKDPASLIERLIPLRQLVGGEEFKAWEELAAERRMPELFARLMRVHYDPAYARSITKHYPQIGGAMRVTLPALDVATLAQVAIRLSANRDPSFGTAGGVRASA